MSSLRKESKRRNSILNACSSMLYTCVNGILTIIVTRIVLVHYGSDYNGLNATANQIVSILLVLESGFTLASNVALFSPLSNKDNELVRKIISTTKSYFRKIGLAYLFIGFAVVLVYSRFVVSSIPYYEVLLILLISLIPTAFNLIFATKYTVLFQSSQHEYIINFLKVLSCIIGHTMVIIIGGIGINRILLRVLMLLNPIISIALIILVGKRRYSYLDMNLLPDKSLIPGTKDLMIQKFVGLAYSTAPTLLMSARIGTVAISIYGVYNSVTVLMKSIANAFMNSPRMSLGVLISEKNKERTRIVFKEYETIVLTISTLMTVCYYSLIIPFVSIYTRGVHDANYIQNGLAVVLGLIFYIECLHIPSGIFLNMAGLFKVSRNIQSIAAIILAINLVISCFIGTIISFVIAILVAAISLALMEIGYVHFGRVMSGNSMDRRSIIDIIVFTILTVVLSFIGFNTTSQCSSYIDLIISALLVFALATAIIFIFLAIYNREFLSKYIGVLRRVFINLMRKS